MKQSLPRGGGAVNKTGITCGFAQNEETNTGWTGQNYGVAEAFSYKMTGKDKRKVKRIIVEYFSDQRTKANFELSPSDTEFTGRS
jgi:hypothetical protein